MRATWMRPLVASLLLGAFTLSCGPVEEKDENIVKVESHLKTCDVNLQAGNFELARNAAENVVTSPKLMSVDDVSVDRTIFCYTTANTLYQVDALTTSLANLMSSVVGLIGGEGFSLSPQKIQKLAVDYRDGRLDPQAASIISTVVGGFVGPIKKMLEENQELMEVMIKRGRYSYYIEHVPVKIAGAQIMDAGGKVDMGEVYLLYGITRALLGMFYLGDSQDYTFTLKILSYINVEGNPLMQFGDGPEKLAPAIFNAIAVLMGTSPNFLTLDNQVGAEMMKQAGEGFSSGFDGILKGIKHMKEKRKGDQSVYVVEYRREAIGGKDEDVLVLNWEWNQGANPLPIVDLGGFSGMVIPLSEDILTSLGKLRDDFGLAEGVDTSLQEDVFPIIALMTVVLLNTGAFDALIGLVLDSAEGDQKEQIDQVLNIVKGNRDLITGALQALVPVNILFDFGQAFKDPKGIRDLFPAWTQPSPSAEIEQFVTATLVYSYECAEPGDPLLTAKFLCETEADKSHFHNLDGSPFIAIRYDAADEEFATPLTHNTGLTWTNHLGSDNFGATWDANMDANGNTEMGQDGIASVFPYIGFKDPTFGGILYLDVSSLQNEYITPQTSGFELANLKTLNATFAKIFEAVQGFL
jgi:hypothetical protein